MGNSGKATVNGISTSGLLCLFDVGYIGTMARKSADQKRSWLSSGLGFRGVAVLQRAGNWLHDERSSMFEVERWQNTALAIANWVLWYIILYLFGSLRNSITNHSDFYRKASGFGYGAPYIM